MNLKSLLQTSKSLSVLYIEDDNSRESTLELFSQMFHLVVSAVDGIDGLNQYIKYHQENEKYIDLVISDINMPNMDGLELSKRIFKLNNKQILIVTSSHNDSKRLIELINLGVTSFLIKPIQRDNVINILYKACVNINNTNLVLQHDIHIKELNKSLQNSNLVLEKKVEQRTKELENLLLHDTLTGLRSQFSLIKDIENSKHPILFLINLDSFHNINDYYGYENSNNLLIQFAQCLKLFNSMNYNIYRVYADEFVMYKESKLESIGDYKKDLIILLNNITEYNFTIKEGKSIELNATIGLSVDEQNPLMTASIAIKHAKRYRKIYTIYEKKIDNSNPLNNVLQWSTRLKKAIEMNYILTAFQPIVDIDGKILKYEALMRVAEHQDGTLKIISPYEFLEPSIETRQYNSMMSILIEKCFITMYNRVEDFSINLSYGDIYNNTLINILIDNLQRFKKIGKRLIIEILETESIEDLEVMQLFIKEIRTFGVRVAIDDFGTGHSNFSNIIAIDPDYIKIDGSFIKNIDTDHTSYTLVKGIVNSSKDLNIKTIAEFVHKKEVFDIVKDLGVDEFQGYYFSEPLLNI